MLTLPTLTTLVAAASLAEAHNSFVRIAHNGEWKKPLQYIRNNTSPYISPNTLYNPDLFGFPIHTNFAPSPTNETGSSDYPVRAQYSPESIRCGRDNLAWANDTETLKVRPGDTIEFLIVHSGVPPYTWDDPAYIQWNNCPEGKGACHDSEYGTSVNVVIHEGPVMMHLSRVPAGQDVRAYDGSGEWVKIYTMGIEIRKELDYPVYWLPRGNQKTAPRFIATIPKQTPSGQYLMRADQVYYGSYRDHADPQVYPACAHIEVISDTTGDLPKGVKIPEALRMDQPGMAAMYKSQWPNKYTYPGGPLWDGEKLEQDYPPHWDGAT